MSIISKIFNVVLVPLDVYMQMTSEVEFLRENFTDLTNDVRQMNQIYEQSKEHINELERRGLKLHNAFIVGITRVNESQETIVSQQKMIDTLNKKLRISDSICNDLCSLIDTLNVNAETATQMIGKSGRVEL